LAPLQTVVVLCGAGKELQIAVKEKITRLSILESSVRTNF